MNFILFIHFKYEICLWCSSNAFLNLFLVFFLCILCSLQGIKEGWYDGGSIAFAVLLVIVVTGIELACLFNVV